MDPFAVEAGVSLPEHGHTAPQSNNVVAHDPVGYCGNTVTTVRCEKLGKQEERWERSFWGGSSVGLTDFLRWLDFSEDICRCLPEYYVKTELEQMEYGINLTGGYVRLGDKQCQLTEDQVSWLAETLEAVKAGTGKELCALPPAERPVFGE
ncbi:MAG: hypothetical protein IJB75_01170 [Oscillospiraceae bacterium]|nr:hypothetical protein [Oscillospiraceae bacterium]